MRTLLLIALALVFLLDLLTQRALSSISVKELRRRARAQDRIAARIYKLAAYGFLANIFLWLVASLGLAGLVIWTSHFSWWAAGLEILAASWLLWFPKPLKKYGNFSWQLASFLVLPRARLVSWLPPALKRFAGQPDGLKSIRKHTGAYEKEDLLELLKVQHNQADNRISESDLKLALSVLQFGDKTVGKIMRPRKAVKWVSEDEPIGPLLMDELYDSEQESFPVVKDLSKKSQSPEIVGTLYLRDLVGHDSGGRVGSLMRKEAYFINEDDSLREALDAFNKTHHHLLVVINDFEEVVGVLPFGVLVQQILGEKLNGEFDQYQDKRAVASKKAIGGQNARPEDKK